MDATIVIPTYNRADRLLRCLKAIGEQDLSAYTVDVVVVDDGSEDETVSLVNDLSTSFPLPLQIIPNNGRGPSAARNTGMAAAAGFLILYTDDDCVPHPDWAFSLIDYINNHPGVNAVGGEIERLHDTHISRYIDNSGFMRQVREGDVVMFLVTANAGFEKESLMKVGGFDERITIAGGEDYELSHRIRQKGGTIRFVQRAVIKHEHHQKLRGLHRMNWRHGKGLAFQRELGVPGEYPGQQDFRWFLKRCSSSYSLQVRCSGGPLSKRLAYWFLDVFRWCSFSLGYNS